MTYRVYKEDDNNDGQDFSDLYLSVRQKEGRLFTDEQVRILPLVDRKHPHFKEWKIRKHSAKRLYDYLKSRGDHLSILEVGCGNGWLSFYLSHLLGSQVMGIDINRQELAQAKRVFGAKENLCFDFGSLDQVKEKGSTFDIILFASSIQYFPNIRDVIDQSLLLLKEGGEIHIIDSPFYEEQQLERARHRSDLYYQALDCSEMAKYYYHHSLEDLEGFGPQILYRPGALSRWSRWAGSPFFWIRIKKS